MFSIQTPAPWEQLIKQPHTNMPFQTSHLFSAIGGSSESLDFYPDSLVFLVLVLTLNSFLTWSLVFFQAMIGHPWKTPAFRKRLVQLPGDF